MDTGEFEQKNRHIKFKQRRRDEGKLRGRSRGSPRERAVEGRGKQDRKAECGLR